MKIRVLRVVEFVGEEEAVARQVKYSIHGTTHVNGVQITAATFKSEDEADIGDLDTWERIEAALDEARRGCSCLSWSPMAGNLQALSFAYGNLACSTNHKPERAAFKKVWIDNGLPPEDFDAWAADKEWK